MTGTTRAARGLRPCAPLLIGAVLMLCVSCTSATVPTTSGRHTGVATRAPAATGTTAPQPADCLGSQLTASLGEHGPALGTEGVVLLLHNVGATACRLTGVPSLQGIDRQGHATRLGFRAATTPAQAVQPPGTGSQRLGAGRDGAMLLTECLADECPKPAVHWVTRRIGLPDGQHVSMPYPSVLRLGSPGTITPAQPVPAPTGILGHG